MVAIKSLIVPAFIFFEAAQSYCIYNHLDQGSFYIIQREGLVPYTKLFKKTLDPGASECCHYTNKDCSVRQVNKYRATFEITFDWPTHRSEVYEISCYTGGSLSIRGSSEDDFYAICRSADGIEYTLDFVPKSND